MQNLLLSGHPVRHYSPINTGHRKHQVSITQLCTRTGKPFSDGFGASGGERRAMDGIEQQDAKMATAAAPGAAEEDVTDYGEHSAVASQHGR